MALSKPSRRYDLLFDPMKLSEALGYDFHLVGHGLDLIRSVGPAIVPATPGVMSSEPVPLFELNEKKKSRLVLWSRGHYKTSAVALYMVNLILAYPDIRILMMQSTAKNTRGLLREVKSHFDGTNEKSTLPRDFPKWCKTKTRLGTADGFISPARKRTHLKDMTVTVAGSKTVKTGQHFDFQFYDDLVNDQNFRNQEIQERLIEDFDRYTALLDPGGFKTVTGTRYSFGDLYGYLIRRDAERNEWDISVKTCWKDDVEANGPFFPRLALEGRNPIGFTTEMLKAIQADNPASFSCQYLNQPLIAGNQLFTQELLMSKVRMVTPERIPTLGPSILFLDLANSKRTEADHSVIVCGRQTVGRMYVCDVRAGKYSPLQLAHNTIEMVLRHRPSAVFIEGTPAGNYFIEYLRVIAAAKGIVLPIEPIKVTNNKDAKHLRISSIEGVLKNDSLFFLAGLPGWEEIVEQFTQFPRGRHDDEIDTISLMVQYYTQNSEIFMHRPVQTLMQYITRPTPLIDIVERQFSPAIDEESCGAYFAS